MAEYNDPPEVDYDDRIDYEEHDISNDKDNEKIVKIRNDGRAGIVVNGIIPNVLFVSRFGRGLSKDDFLELFNKFGETSDITVRDNIAFVDFRNPEDAKAAKEALHRKAGLRSDSLVVDFKKDRPETASKTARTFGLSNRDYRDRAPPRDRSRSRSRERNPYVDPRDIRDAPRFRDRNGYEDNYTPYGGPPHGIPPPYIDRPPPSRPDSRDYDRRPVSRYDDNKGYYDDRIRGYPSDYRDPPRDFGFDRLDSRAPPLIPPPNVIPPRYNDDRHYDRDDRKPFARDIPPPVIRQVRDNSRERPIRTFDRVPVVPRDNYDGPNPNSRDFRPPRHYDGPNKFDALPSSRDQRPFKGKGDVPNNYDSGRDFRRGDYADDRRN